MEACRGAGGPQKCSDALNAQKIVTKAIDDKNPTSILWLTHSNTIPAPMQCKLLKKLQDEYPWIQAGTDFLMGVTLRIRHSTQSILFVHLHIGEEMKVHEILIKKFGDSSLTYE